MLVPASLVASPHQNNKIKKNTKKKKEITGALTAPLDTNKIFCLDILKPTLKRTH